jgi:hypothetical protein
VSQTPHDAFFKSIFSQPLQAAEVLQQALPPEVVRLLDFSTLTPEPGSFIDEALRGQCTDLLFSARFAGRPTLLYLLFEHMSTQEVFMPLRMSGYMNEIWKGLVIADRPRHLPVIVPVVLHHSELGWRTRTSFQAMFDPELPAPLRAYVPHFHLGLEDLSTRSDEELLARAMSAVSKLALSALKHARTAEDLLRFVPSWARLVHDVLCEPNGADALARVFRYLCLVRGALGGDPPADRRRGRERRGCHADDRRDVRRAGSQERPPKGSPGGRACFTGQAAQPSLRAVAGQVARPGQYGGRGGARALVEAAAGGGQPRRGVRGGLMRRPCRRSPRCSRSRVSERANA